MKELQNIRKWLLIICLLICGQAWCQHNYLFRRLNQVEGVREQTISCIDQDARGFIWVGTDAGLTLFDGIRFVDFALPHNGSTAHVSNERIFSMALAPDSSLWVCTINGLTRIDTEKWLAEVVDVEGMEEGDVFDVMTFDRDGSLWATGINGSLCRIDIQQRRLRRYGEGGFSTLTITRSGQLWVAHIDGSMHLYNALTDKLVKYPAISSLKKIKDFIIVTLTETAEGDLMMVTNRMGVSRFSPVTHQCSEVVKEDEDGREFFCHCAVMPDGKTLWLGTEDGILIYREGEGIVTHMRKSNVLWNALSDNAVHKLFCDRQKSIWVGTFFGGLNQVVDHNHSFIPHPALNAQGMPCANVMRNITSDDDQHLWVGTEDGGLFLLDKETEMLRAANLTWEGKPLSNNIQGMCYIGDNELWVGTFDAGIYVVDTKGMRVVDHKWSGDGHSEIHNDAVVKILHTRDGEIWIGTLVGCLRYNQKKKCFEPVKSLDWQSIHDLHEDEKGNIWVASIGHGLMEITKAKGQWQCFSTDLPFLALTCVTQDQRGEVLVGTHGGGLFTYNPATKKSKRINLNVPNNNKLTICSITEDRQGRLWISTSNGLLCYYPQQGHSVFYDKQNLPGKSNFNLFSAMRDKDGVMWMGTLNGLLSFNPEYFVPLNEKPEVYILNSTVDQTNALIHFASPSYMMSNTVWYRYRLKGSSDKWIVCQEPEILNYSHLAPGHYTLEIQATYDPDKWEGNITSTTFYIAPPWWLSGWAYLIYILIVVTCLALCFWWWWRRHQRKLNDTLTRIEAEKYRDILQAKISFFTAITHEIRTPLTLIMAGLEKMQRNIGKDKRIAPTDKEAKKDSNASLDNDITTLQHNSQRLLTLVNQLLDFRRIESQQMLMNFSLHDITSIIRQICTDFQPLVASRHVEMKVTLPDHSIEVLADKEALVKMLTNQIGNALKFCERTVEVSISQVRAEDDMMIRVRVVNDGPRIPDCKVDDIFKPFEQYHDAQSKATIKGSGLGLPLTRSLAQMHGGNYYFDTTEKALNAFVLELKMLSGQKQMGTETETQVMTQNSNKQSDANKPVLLLVDDENDLRRFVAEELEEHYTVLQAENGKEALDVLKEHNVTLIISDIMMPVMDGVTLCQRIKENERTSHIPIVMLTAKVSMQDHIDALNSHADAYIEKPFTTAHLLAQISNLLHNRELMRQRFANSPYAIVSDFTTNDTEQKFLEKMNAYITQNLTNERFSVDDLAAHMAMSKSTLYRKMKSACELSPLDYINLCRLKEAANMLANKRMTIKAVSEALNFSSVSYFTSCFMKQFGITPGEFVKQNQKNAGRKEG